MKNLVILVVVLILIVVGIVFLGQDRQDSDEILEYSIDQSREIALGWMEDSAPTYVFDGSDLELEDEREVDENTFRFTFSFESSAAGYGDREGEILAQVITPHSTEVTVFEGEVTEAVTDGVFSELEGRMLDDEELENAENNQTSVSIYFLETVNGEERLVAVEREVSAQTPGREALEELLAGPTSEEEDAGLTTALNEGVEILDLIITEGLAMVDFSSELNEDVAGSARVMAIRDQIERTLLQFSTVVEVVISVEGESEEILQP